MTEEEWIPWLGAARRDVRRIVGVSGGADSVALLHLLVGAGFRELVVCHLDHGLRGRASTEDARFVKRLADRLGLVCEVGRADVRGMMEREGISLETAARKARHLFFAECVRKHGCDEVLLAHHADDQAETVLWNLLRGSRGLKGMREEQRIEIDGCAMRLVRPLLGARHADLVGWLRAKNLRWREDESNREPVAVRNRLRNEVMPLLDEVSGRDAVAAVVRAATDAAEVADLLEKLVKDAAVTDPQGRLHLGVLRSLHPLVRKEAIRGYLAEQGVGGLDRALMDRAEAMLATGGPAVVNLPGGGRLRRRAGRMWVESTGRDNFAAGGKSD